MKPREILAEFRPQINAAWLRWLEAEQGRFALWLPVAAMAGDAAYFALRREPPVWPCIGGLLSGVCLAALRRSLVVHAAGLMLTLFCFGFGAAQMASRSAPPFAALPTHAAQISGRIAAVEALPSGARLTLDRLRVENAAIGDRRLRIRAPDDPALVPGAWVSLRAMIAPPSPPAYPGGRDLQRDAWFDGLQGYGYALGAVTVIRSGSANRVAALRARVADRIRTILPGAPGALAATLLTGLSAALSDPDRAAFRDAGLSHLLAIAGLHIAIVMGLVLATARLILLRSERVMLFWPTRVLASCAALLAGLGYLVLTGLHVPTLRSFTMAALVGLALLSGRRAVSLRGWGLAVLAVIALEPEKITGASFQLSFAAVLALIAGYAAMRGPLQSLRTGDGRWRPLAHHVIALALTSLLAGAASMPFVAYHFGSVQIYFVLANLIAVPLTALWVMPAGLLALLLMPLGLDGWALHPMGWGIGALLWIAHTIAGWPDATLAVPHVPMRALVPIAAGLAWLCLWRSRLRLLGWAPIAAGIVVGALARPPDVLVAADGRLAAVSGRHGLEIRALRGGDAYVQAAWQQYLGLAAAPLRAASDADCENEDCLVRRVRFGSAGSPCDAAVLVVQAGAAPYCPDALTIDRGSLSRNGATAVWLSRPPRETNDRAVRGDRPWVFLQPEQDRAQVGLPMAAIERLPPAGVQ